MKIVFFGDSVTDAERDYQKEEGICAYGFGYVMQIAGKLLAEAPENYQILNKGINGNKIVDLYARAKMHVWSHKPDVISVLVGVNDVWHDFWGHGVEIERYEKVYSSFIEETKERLPDTKIILCEPFVLHGTTTDENYEGFQRVKDYAKVVKKLAEKYDLPFLPLQEKFDEAAAKHGAKYYSVDGVHPEVAGAALIAAEWLKLFKETV